MKVIPPYKIGSEILDLIYEAEEFIVIVSPYFDIMKWGSMKDAITNALNRGIGIEFYTRNESTNSSSWFQAEALGLKPKLVTYLHAKLYYSEKSGIVTSMNLLTGSHNNAIDFGAIYDQPDELSEIENFVKKYVAPVSSPEKPDTDELFLTNERFSTVLENAISNELDIRASCRWRNNQIQIRAYNQFFLGADKSDRSVYLTSIISSDEFDKSKDIVQLLNEKYNDFNVFVDKGEGSQYDLLVIESKNSFTSHHFDYLKVEEKKTLINLTISFIDSVLKFKKDVYESNRK